LFCTYPLHPNSSQDDLKASGGKKKIGGLWEQNMAAKKEEQFQKVSEAEFFF